MMKGKILGVLFVFIFLLSSCGQKEEIYDLGFIGTLTGPYAEVGLAEMYGVQLAVEEINAAGGIQGRELVVHYRDDKADPELAVSLQNELYNLGIDVIIGHSLSLVAIEAVENANEKEILLLSPSIGTDELSGIDDMLIRNVADTSHEGEFMTQKIVQGNPEKVLMLYNTDNLILTKYHRDSFVRVMESSGYTTEDYLTLGFASGNQSDLNQVYAALDSLEYDAVFIASSNLDAAGMVNYMKVNNMDAAIHLSSWAATGLIENIDLSRVDNIYGYFNFDSFASSQEYLAFRDQYIKDYGQDPNMLSVNAYDMVYVLKQAVEGIEDFDNLQVKEEILRMGTIDGINAPFSFNEYGDCIKEHIQLIIEDGVYIKVE